MAPLFRLVAGIAIGVGMAAGIWMLALAGQLGRPHVHNQWVVEAYAHKQTIAEQTPSPRVLIAGGSSAMFGIDSSHLEGAMNMPTVNLAVNAGLGLPVILNRTLRAVQRDDMVVLALEYPLYGYDGSINHVMNDFYLSHPAELTAAWQSSREALPIHRWLPLMAGEAFQIVMQTSAERVLQGYRGLPEGFRVEGTYGAHRLDPRGDQTHTLSSLRAPWMKEQVVAEGAQRYGARHEESAAGWYLLRRFADELEARGACLVLVPPAFLFDDSYLVDPLEREFYTSLPAVARRHGLSFVGDPFDFMYEAQDMFDTNYHLVDEARQVNTQRLSKALLDASSAAQGSLQPVINCPESPIESGMTR